jgi:hypothetical protein
MQELYAHGIKDSTVISVCVCVCMHTHTHTHTHTIFLRITVASVLISLVLGMSILSPEVISLVYILISCHQ